MTQLVLLSVEEVIVIHDRLIKIGGGEKGISNFGFLHAAVNRPAASFLGKYLYKNIWFKAAALLHSLINNPPFADGNKQTAFFSTQRFLKLNNKQDGVKKDNLVSDLVSIVKDKWSVKQIASWLKGNHK